MREPVLTHTATQHIAAQEGATFVGIRLHDHLPFQQVGITDGLTHSRSSLSVAYSALRPLAPATVWVPDDYRPFLEHILRGTDWNRSLGEGTPEARWPDRSHSSSTYDTDERLGDITVEVIGDDLVDVVDATIEQMRHSGAAVVRVHLPANDPALAVVGAGLPDLGLGFTDHEAIDADIAGPSHARRSVDELGDEAAIPVVEPGLTQHRRHEQVRERTVVVDAQQCAKRHPPGCLSGQAGPRWSAGHRWPMRLQASGPCPRVARSRAAGQSASRTTPWSQRGSRGSARHPLRADRKSTRLNSSHT